MPVIPALEGLRQEGCRLEDILGYRVSKNKPTTQQFNGDVVRDNITAMCVSFRGKRGRNGTGHLEVINRAQLVTSLWESLRKDMFPGGSEVRAHARKW